MKKVKNWSRGITLTTQWTQHWTKEEVEENDLIERSLVFTDFNFTDRGKSRKRVAQVNREHPDYEFNAKLIKKAPQLLNFLIDQVAFFESSFMNGEKNRISEDVPEEIIKRYREAKKLLEYFQRK